MVSRFSVVALPQPEGASPALGKDPLVCGGGHLLDPARDYSGGTDRGEADETGHESNHV